MFELNSTDVRVDEHQKALEAATFALVKHGFLFRDKKGVLYSSYEGLCSDWQALLAHRLCKREDIDKQ